MGWDDEVVEDRTIKEGTATSSHVTARISSPRKKRGLFDSYDTHIEADIDRTVSQSQSASTVVMLYVNNIKGFYVQGRKSHELWDIFKADVRFC